MGSDNVRIDEWGEAEFLSARAAHTDLLERSSADPLFQSWEWLSLWWTHFGRPTPGCHLRVLAAYDGSSLVGLLPLVDGHRTKYPVATLRSANVLGSFFRLGIGIPTEYQDVIAEAGREPALREAFVRYLKRHSSADEISIGWCHQSHCWQSAFRNSDPREWEYSRRVDPVTAYSANLSLGFEHYSKCLSGSARRALVNMRRKLHDMGKVEFHGSHEGSVGAVLSRLNELHALRWGAPAFDDSQLRFHREFTARLPAKITLAISELRIDERPVSILYDVRSAYCQYNIHLGFDPAAISSGSLGLLHLGYAMESAAAAGLRRYDLLGGKGKNTDYKSRFATDSVELATVQLLRAPLASMLFRAKDACTGR